MRGQGATHAPIVGEGGTSIHEKRALDQQGLVRGKNGFILGTADNQSDYGAGQVADESRARIRLASLGEREHCAFVARRFALLAFSHVDVTSWIGGLLPQYIFAEFLGHLGELGDGRLLIGAYANRTDYRE